MIWDHTGPWGVGEWLAMGLLMIVLWGLFVAAIIWLVRGFHYEPTSLDEEHPTSPRADANQVPAQPVTPREIDEQELTQHRELQHSGRP